MQSPVIICHMVTSLDGRLLPDRWPWTEEEILNVYDEVAERLDTDGWIVDRHTMAHYLASGEPALAGTRQGHGDRVAAGVAGSIGVCFDRSGRLRPETGEILEDHLVLVLSDRVSAEHVEDLVARGVSVFFAGEDGEDIAGALSRIAEAFGARRLLLEGGGQMNAAFLAADRIDETSTLILPVIDGDGAVRAIYDGDGHSAGRELELLACEPVTNGAVWLRHKVRRG